ncbi:MAG: hypothetical protein ABFS32_22975 [Bacteroidota bacterium]
MYTEVVLYSGLNQIFPLEPMAVKNSIKQIVPGYLPYLLLTLLQLNIYQGNSADSYPIGVIVGPGITVGNLAMAGSANKNMLNELNEYNIMNRDIQRGETIYGIIGVRDMDYNPISVKLRE